MSQDQLFNAGPVKIYRGTYRERDRDRAKVADGSNLLRMQRRAAAKRGMSLDEYLLVRMQEAIEAEHRAVRNRIAFIPIPITKVCAECGGRYETFQYQQATCSDDCRRKHASRLHMERYYSRPEYRDRHIADIHARRASRLGLGNRKITLGYLLERDSWRCGICRKRIRKYEDASIDHIVPLADGRMHSLENVQPTHLLCNLKKGNRGGGEQLLIVG